MSTTVTTPTGEIVTVNDDGTVTVTHPPDGLAGRVAQLEQQLADVTAGVEAAVGALWARGEVRTLAHQLAGTGDVVRINGETINPTTGEPYGDTLLVFTRSTVTVWGDGGQVVAFSAGWNYLDVPTAEGSTYVVVAVEPIESAPSPLPAETPAA